MIHWQLALTILIFTVIEKSYSSKLATSKYKDHLIKRKNNNIVYVHCIVYFNNID